MRFAPLSVELIRARPRLVFSLAVLGQAALWFVLPLLLYASAPGGLPTTLAIGRDYALSHPAGPPLAFWLADIAYTLAGRHLFGVYLLSQLCLIATFWALYQLGRVIVGASQSVLAVLLTLAITAFAFPQAEFGPDVLAQPLWALTLVCCWRAVAADQRRAWIGLAMSAGLLLMTSAAAPLLLALMLVFLVATARGRQRLSGADPWFALLLVAVLVFPYALVLLRQAPDMSMLAARLTSLTQPRSDALWQVAIALMSLAGVVLVTLAGSRWVKGPADDPPEIARRRPDPLAKPFILTFAIAPFIATAIVTIIVQSPALIGGAGLSLMLSGLAIVMLAGDSIRLRNHTTVRRLWLLVMAVPVLFVVGTALLQPWVLGREVPTMLPSARIAAFVAETYEKRTGQRLRMVSGDPELATAISLAARGRPQLLLARELGGTPGLTPETLTETGGVIVWRATDTSGTPPTEIAQRFPGLVPEVPVTFSRYMQGRQPLLRIGWAVVRPASAPATR